MRCQDAQVQSIHSGKYCLCAGMTRAYVEFVRGMRRFLGLTATMAFGVAGAVMAASGPVAAAGEFTVSPTTLTFPSTYVGATASIAVTVANVSQTNLTPNFAGGAPLDATNFGGSQDCAGKSFAPGDTCTFTFEFTPESPGTHSSSTTIGVGSDNFSISMSGTALVPFDVSPTTLTFPDTAVGSTSTIPIVVTNISPASQSPNFAGGAPLDPTHFGGSQDCAGKTFAPGDSCTFTYEFTPTSPGAHASSTTIAIDGQSYPVTMSGNGLDPSNTTTTSTSTSTTSTTIDSTSTTSTSPDDDDDDDDDDLDDGGDDDTDPTATPPVGDGVVPVVPGPLPADSPAAVIAQGVVEFGTGEFAWEHAELEPSGWPHTFAVAPPAFFVDDGPDGLLVTIDGTSSALLDVGEAVFVPAGSSGEVAPLFDGAVAAAHRITFVAAGGEGSFTPGAGSRDVNLIRGVLEPGETLEVLSPFPVLVIVTDGEVVDATGATDDDSALSDGTTVVLDPGVALRNEGDGSATVIAVAVGGQVP